MDENEKTVVVDSNGETQVEETTVVADDAEKTVFIADDADKTVLITDDAEKTVIAVDSQVQEENEPAADVADGEASDSDVAQTASEIKSENDASSSDNNDKKVSIIVAACAVVVAAAAVIFMLVALNKKTEYEGEQWYDKKVEIDSTVEQVEVFENLDASTSSIADSWEYGVPVGESYANDGKYYYIDNPLDDHKVYKIEMSAPYTNYRISTIPGSDINIIGDKVYFNSSYAESGDEAGIYVMDKDGNNLECMNVGSFSDLKVVNDWVFYLNSNTKKIEKMNTFNRKIYEIGPDNVWTFAIKENTIILETYDKNGKSGARSQMLSMDVDGENIEEITKAGDYRAFVIDNDYIYYALEDSKLGRIKLEDNSDEVLSKGYPDSNVSIAGNKLFFVDNKEGLLLKVLDVDDKSIKKYNLKKVTGIYTTKDLLFVFYREDGSTPYVTVNDLNTGKVVEFFKKGV